MKKLLFCCASLLVVISVTVMADSYRQISLKYRDAAVLQQRLAPLMSKDVVIAVDGRQLIIRGPLNELNQLEAIIKNLDAAQRQLEIFLYRGENPFAASKSHDDLHWSTSTRRANTMQSAVIADGSSLWITETELKLIHESDTEGSAYFLEQDILRTQEKEMDNSALTISAYRASDHQGKVISWTQGVKLTPSFIDNENVAISVQFDLPQGQPSQNRHPNGVAKTQTTLQRVIKPGEWIELTRITSKAERPALMSNRRIYSTQKADEFDDAVWVKVTERQ